MATIQGGTLSLEALWESGAFDRGLKTAEVLVKNFTSLTVKSGANIDAEYQKMAAGIDAGFKAIGNSTSINAAEVDKLTVKFRELGIAAGDSFARKPGGGGMYTEEQIAIQKQIKAHEATTQKLSEQDAALLKLNKDVEDHKNKLDNATNGQVRFRTQLLNVKNEMMQLEQAGKKNTAEYARLTEEAKRLANAMYAANSQIKTLTSVKGATLQGFVSGISGISGAFTAAQGAMGLFASKNEDLQKIMLKVQSLMSITMGLQAVSATLHQTSAFRVTIVAKAQQWWAGVITKTNAALLASTVEGKAAALAEGKLAAAHARVAAATAIVEKQEVKRGIASTAAYARLGAAQKNLTRTQALNTAATAAQSSAAAGATVANKGLAGGIRMVGVAIKSIPGLGWVLAIVGALVVVVAKFSSEARKAKKEMEAFYKSAAEGASKPIAEFRKLQAEWNNVGDNIGKRIAIAKDLKKSMEELGVAVNGVIDAEKILTDPKNVQAYIAAQIAKARASAKGEEIANLEKEAAITKQKLEDEQKKPTIKRYHSAGGFGYDEITNPEIKLQEKELEKIIGKITAAITDMGKYQKEAITEMEKATEGAITKYSDGTVGALENAIKKERDALEPLKGNNKAYKEKLKQIESLEQQLNAITGKGKEEKKEKDPVLEELEAKKKAYQEYFKWVNATDENVRGQASTAFSELLKGGQSYKEYLNKQIAGLQELQSAGKATEKDVEKLHKLTTALQEESKKTVMSEWEKSLQTELGNANSILGMLDIIDKRRAALKDDDPLKPQKTEALDKQQEDVALKIEKEYRSMVANYSDYLENVTTKTHEYFDKVKILKSKLDEETDEKERERIQNLMRLYGMMYDAQIGSFEEVKEIAEESVKVYGDIEQREALITKKYQKEIYAAKISAQKESNKELKAQWENVIKKLGGQRDLEIMSLSDDYNDFFKRILELSGDTAKNIHDALKQQLDKLLEEGKITLEKYKEETKKIDDQLEKKEKSEAEKNEKGGAGQLTEMLNENETFQTVSRIIKEIHQSIQASQQMVESIVELRASMGKNDDLGTFWGDLEQYGEVLSEFDSKVYSGFEKFKSGDFAGAIADNVSAYVGIFTSLNSINDKKIEKDIQNHVANVKQLQNEYKNLERSVDKALGSNRYTTQKSELDNLKAQQAEYNAMADKERDKKKSDAGKIEEYENAAADNAMKILDVVDKIREDIMGGTAGSIANDLGNAFIDAFAAGENALDAFQKKADDVVAGIMRKMLIQKLLEQPIGDIISRYSQKWLDDKGGFIGFDAVMRDADAMGGELKRVGSTFAAAMESLPEEVKKYFTGEDEGPATSLSGAIKGASQESIDLLAGQTNAVRVNQVESIEILRNSLIQLTMISANTGKSSKHLESIDSKMSNSNVDPLRSQGVEG
jgi:hypothetical protein